MMLHDAPLADTVSKLRRGAVDLDTYLDETKARGETVEPKIEPFVAEDDRWGRIERETNRIKKRFRDGVKPPLYGIPIGVKDIFHVNGLPTRAGSGVPPETLAGDEASVVTTLKEAGALVLAKTVTAEFAYFEPGATRNPHNPDHTPGGSSSGSAAAVAAGLCPLALGTQTIGSITRPAAFCGIVGFKPSYGRISTEGVIPCSKSVDHVGLFTQDTAGAHLAASILCNEWQPVTEPTTKPTLGVPEGPYLQQANTTGREAFADHISILETAGYEIKRVSTFNDIGEINERHERLVAAEFALVHDGWYRSHPGGYADASVELLEEGRTVSTEEMAVSRHSRTQLREVLEREMKTNDIDMWVSPAAPGPAPEGIDTTGDPVMNLPWTHAGVPTVGIPAGKSKDGLPLGLQFAAPFGADEDLLAWSHEIQRSL